MGWIEKTKNGLRYVERIKIDGKYKRLTTPIEKDTPQARRNAIERLYAKKEAFIHPQNKMPLNRLIAIYIEKKNCKESTKVTAERSLLRIAGILGDCKLEATSINRALMESDVKPSTINHCLQSFRAFLKWCYTYGYIEDNIANNIMSLHDPSPKTPTDEKYLEPDELENVLLQLHGMYYYFCKFLVLTGCRVGEASALLTSDIDSHIHITKTYSMDMVGTPKTESSYRDIMIQNELRSFLDEYMRWRNLWMLKTGIRSDLLFFTRHGNHLLSTGVSNALKRVQCEKPLHAHIFRHTHVALLAEAGVPLDVISRRLGHSNSTITRDVYFHVTRKMRQKDDEAIKNISIL